jgi:class I fructose-bisphosphate aldolase
MALAETVKRILGNYESDNPGTKANLARILMQGKLGGAGRLLILPVDQGVDGVLDRGLMDVTPISQ